MHPVGIRLMPRPYVKIASLLATALLAASILPASGLAADKTVVTVAYSPTFVFDTNDLAAKWWNSIKDQFEKQYPNAEVKLVPIEGGYDDIVNKLSLLYRSPATTPDVVQIPTPVIAEWVASGYLLPLDSYVAKTDWWQDFPQVIKDEDTFNGKVYAVSSGENDSMLYYNKDMFKKAGLPVPWNPQNWDDILTAFWLRRHDPHKARGRTCFWFCLASAVLKMVLTACAMAMIFAAGMNLHGGEIPRKDGNPAFPEAFFGPLYLMAAGVPLLAICACTGCFSARWNRLRVWLSPSLDRARKNGCWPPDLAGDFAGSQENATRPPWLAMVAILITLVSILAALSCVFALVVGAMVLAGGLIAIPLVARGVTATHPGDCWGEFDARWSRRLSP